MSNLSLINIRFIMINHPDLTKKQLNNQLKKLFLNDKILNQDSERVVSNIDFKPLSNATIFITGATGLIGTQLISSLSYLHKLGIKFTVYFQHYSKLSDQIEKLTDNFNPIKTDLSDFNYYGQLPKADFIIHAAGYAQPSMFMAEPEKTLSINSTLTCALLKKLNSGGKFLYRQQIRMLLEA